jgi:hypothetical protein
VGGCAPATRRDRTAHQRLAPHGRGGRPSSVRVRGPTLRDCQRPELGTQRITFWPPGFGWLVPARDSPRVPFGCMVRLRLPFVRARGVGGIIISACKKTTSAGTVLALVEHLSFLPPPRLERFVSPKEQCLTGTDRG